MQITKMQQAFNKTSVRTAPAVQKFSISKPSIKQPFRDGFLCRAEPVHKPGNEASQVENAQAPAGDRPQKQEVKEIQKAEHEAKRQEREEQGKPALTGQAQQTTPEGQGQPKSA